MAERRDPDRKKALGRGEGSVEQRLAELLRENEQLRHHLAKQQHDELRAIYDGMFDGLLVWERETWKIVRGNPALCCMLGYTESELLALQIMDLHPEEEFPAIQNTIRERIAGRFQGVAAATFLRKDRSRCYVEAVSHPITSEGRSCFATFFRDVTARRQAETALRDSEERLRTICDSAMDAVLMLDSAGKALYWNPAAEAMFGYSAAGDARTGSPRPAHGR